MYQVYILTNLRRTMLTIFITFLFLPSSCLVLAGSKNCYVALTSGFVVCFLISVGYIIGGKANWYTFMAQITIYISCLKNVYILQPNNSSLSLV